MAINIQFGDPYAVGRAGLLTGIGDFQKYAQEQALREQAMALQEAQFRESQIQNEFSRNLSVEQLRIGQEEARRLDQLRRAQLASQNAFRSAELEDRQVGRMVGIAQQNAQNDAAMSRQQMQIIAEAERRNFEMTANMAIADWQAIQKTNADKGFSTEGQYQAAVDSWKQKYGQMGMPAPFAAPYEESARLPWQDNFNEEVGFEVYDSEGKVNLDPQHLNALIGFREKKEELKLRRESGDIKIQELATKFNEKIADMSVELRELRIKQIEEREAALQKEKQAKLDARDEAKLAEEEKSIRMEVADKEAMELTQKFYQNAEQRRKLVNEGMTVEQSLIQAPPPVIHAPSTVKGAEAREEYEKRVANSMPIGAITYQPQTKKYYEKVSNEPYPHSWVEVAMSDTYNEKMMGLQGDIYKVRGWRGGTTTYYDTGIEKVEITSSTPPVNMSKEAWKKIQDTAKALESRGAVEIREEESSEERWWQDWIPG